MIVLTATCKNGAIALNDPLLNELEGKQVEIFIREVPSSTKVDRRAFLRLPIAERRQILAQQAEAMVEHYQQDLTWQEWTSFGLEADHES
jgi:hypothetical protein